MSGVLHSGIQCTAEKDCEVCGVMMFLIMCVLYQIRECCHLLSRQQAMAETFYLSNIVPQNYENNAGFWNRCVNTLTHQSTSIVSVCVSFSFKLVSCKAGDVLQRSHSELQWRLGRIWTFDAAAGGWERQKNHLLSGDNSVLLSVRTEI